MNSFKYGVKIPGEAGLCFNAVRFATEPEAREAAKELLSRWYVPTGFEVVPSGDAPNYRFDFDAYRLVRLAE